VYLGDARLEPVMAALDARSALVTIHPVSPCGWEDVSFGRPRPVVEFLFDTTRAVVNLALSGVLDRYPAVRWVVPHAGAALPVLADRVERVGAALERAAGRDPVDVRGVLGRLYYDVAGGTPAGLLPALLSLAGPGRLLYGSDYPFTPRSRVRELAGLLRTTGLLSEQDRPAVLSGNALGLLRRPAGA
jgi:predicted TIM-barrel fold metal-dependent hydrolase